MTERGPKVSETRGKVLAGKAKGGSRGCCRGIRRAGGRRQATSSEEKKRPGKFLVPRKGVGSAKEKWRHDENVETVGGDETHSSRTLSVHNRTKASQVVGLV